MELREQLLEAFSQQMEIRRSLLELENSSMEVQMDTSRHLLTIAESVPPPFTGSGSWFWSQR